MTGSGTFELVLVGLPDFPGCPEGYSAPLMLRLCASTASPDGDDLPTAENELL